MGFIDKLPAELLSAIFLILQRENMLRWFHVLLVCRRWYEVACTTPALWAKLIFDERCNIPVLEAYLRRSAILPLEVSLVVHKLDPGPVFDVLRPHAARLDTLSLSFLPGQRDELQRRLEDVSNAISSLTLHCLTTAAPQFLLNTQVLSRLRSLRATQILPRPLHPPFRGLTHLGLIQIWHATSERAGPWRSVLLSTLAVLPDLEHMLLHDALPPGMPPENQTMEPLPLLSLRTLELNETVEDIKPFLRYLALPASARFTVMARVDGATWDPDVQGVFHSVLPNNYRTTLPMVPLSRALRMFAGHGDEGPLTLSSLAMSHDHPTNRPAWTIIFPDCKEMLPETVAIALGELPTIAPVASLVHLELHIAPHILLLDFDWRELLTRVPQLRKLMIGSSWKAEGAVRALYQHQDLLPDLEELELCCEELLAYQARGPLVPPVDGIPLRFVKSVIIMQAGEAPAPYFEGTIFGSLIESTHYTFRHTSCSACHVSGRVLWSEEPSQDGEASESPIPPSRRRPRPDGHPRKDVPRLYDDTTTRVK